MHRTRPAIILFLAILLQVSAAANAMLRVEILPRSSRCRTAAPIPVLVRFWWDGTGLLQGRLFVEFREDNRVLTRYRSGELVLTSGEQQFRLILPPVTGTHQAQLEVRMWFETETDKIPLPPRLMNVPKMTERSLVVALCSRRDGASPVLRELQRSLRLEHYLPPPKAKAWAERPLLTAMARLAPDELPANPLAFCPYDIVVLDEGALKQLGQRQRHALTRWVKAGGSLCIFAHEAGDKSQHDFIAGLAPENARSVLAGGDSRDGSAVRRFRPGWGRCVVVSRAFDLETSPLEAWWRQQVGFLWKLRRNAAEELAAKGTLDPAALAASAEENAFFADSMHYGRDHYRRNRQPYPESMAEENNFAVFGKISGELIQRLMPEDVRLIPLQTLVGILLLYILMIGPLDWWLLGRLKRRRYTWIGFPCVTAVITLVTVFTANYYLGSSDQQRRLVVVDVGSGGEVLREDSYELVFTGRDRQLAKQQSQMLWSHVDEKNLLSSRYRHLYDSGRFRRYGGTGTGLNENSVEFAGALPISYRVGYKMRKWEPFLKRRLSMKASAGEAPVSWALVDRHLREGRAGDIITELEGAGPNVGAVVFNAGRPHRYLPRRILSDRILIELCAPPPPEGMFVLASQVSPTGGGNFEDLHCLDTSDPGQWLVVITVKMGDDYIIYRRLYHDGR